MTVSVAFDGTVIDTADAATWVGVKITSGGGFSQPSLADAAYEGLNNITLRSDNKRVYAYIDSGTTYDFTTDSSGSGAVKVPNQLFYIWANFLPSPLLNTQAGGGLGVFMESRNSSATIYSLWYFEGRDTYTGGWIRLCIDPNKTPSATNGAGAFDPGAVAHFGAFAHNNVGAAKYDNFVIDQCAVGKGLIVTGTSTLGLAEELVADEVANRHGIVQALNSSGTAVEVLGKITLGDNVGTAVTNINDSNSKFFAANPRYYETTLQPSAPLDFAGLDIVGNGTGNTDVVFGTAVGTTAGRNGIAIVGNSNYNFSVDRDDTAVESADFYGGSFERLTGTLNLDGVHDFNSQTLSDCGASTINSPVVNLTHVASGAITLTGTGTLTDCLVINNTAASSVLTDDLANVVGCGFTSDGSNHAVELSSLGSGSMSWNNDLSGYVDGGVGGEPVTATATGNEAIYVNVGSGTLTINVTAGASVPSIRSLGAVVNVVAAGGSYRFTVSPTPTPNYEWRIYTVTASGSLAGAVAVAGEENETVANPAIYNHQFTNQAAAVQIISADYEEKIEYITLNSSTQTPTIFLELDNND